MKDQLEYGIKKVLTLDLLHLLVAQLKVMVDMSLLVLLVLVTG
jgi:hypothetical protein